MTYNFEQDFLLDFSKSFDKDLKILWPDSITDLSTMFVLRSYIQTSKKTDMEKVKYTAEESMLMSIFLTVEFLATLQSINFTETEMYKQIPFASDMFKEHFRSIGVGNQGTALMMLYAMLVVPKENWVKQKKYEDDFKKVNWTISAMMTSCKSTYKSDSPVVNHITHIRNAISHFRIDWIDEPRSFVFRDNNAKENYEVVIETQRIGFVMSAVQRIFLKFMQEIAVRQRKAKED